MRSTSDRPQTLPRPTPDRPVRANSCLRGTAASPIRKLHKPDRQRHWRGGPKMGLAQTEISLIPFEAPSKHLRSPFESPSKHHGSNTRPLPERHPVTAGLPRSCRLRLFLTESGKPHSNTTIEYISSLGTTASTPSAVRVRGRLRFSGCRVALVTPLIRQRTLMSCKGMTSRRTVQGPVTE